MVDDGYPGSTIVSFTEPKNDHSPTVFSIETASGEARDVYVDPYGPEALGSLDPDKTLSGYAIRLHGELMAGPWGDHVIELGACWAVVMAITGYYLFVRGFRARACAHARPAVEVPSSGGGTAWSAPSPASACSPCWSPGLPWTGFWGEKVQTFATGHGSSLWSLDPGAQSNPSSTLDESLPHSHQQDVPWAMGDSEVPALDAAAGRRGAQRRQRRHRHRGRRPGGAAAPDDRGDARRGRRRTASTR